MMKRLLLLASCTACVGSAHSSEPNGATGSRILYAAKAGNEQGWSIYSMKPDGSDRTLEVPFSSGMGEYNPDVSPDGTAILFNTYRFSGWKLASLDLNTRQVKRLTFEPHYFTNATYSPDGSRMAYEKSIGRETHIAISRTDASDERVLTRNLDTMEHRIPAWMPDGKTLVYYAEKDGTNQVFRIDVGSGAVTPLTTTGNNFSPCVSPDGRTIAFFSDRSGHLDLFTMNADGGNARNRTTGLHSEHNEYNYFRDQNMFWIFKCSWSPGGEALVFSNASASNIDLFTMNSDGSGIRNITNSSRSEYTPVWRRMAR